MPDVNVDQELTDQRRQAVTVQYWLLQQIMSNECQEFVPILSVDTVWEAAIAGNENYTFDSGAERQNEKLP